VTGDMGAFHGLPGLVQAVRDQIPVIVIVEDDGAATTTGGQPTPSAAAENGQREVSLASVARSIGVDHVETVTREAMADASLKDKLRDLAQLSGPSMIIIDEKT
jgi:indolepyruvate ferredoxin oxidoreductase alpha subunit